MTRILGIELAGDYGAGPAMKEAVGDLRAFDQASQAASKSVERLAAQRTNLKMLATAYQDLADTAVKGSDEQQIALGKVADAQKRLAAQVKGADTEMAAANTRVRESAAGLGTLGASAEKTTGLVSKLSSSMALWLGAPALGAGIASAIHSAQSYDAALEQLHTQAGATQQEVTRMNAAVKGMAGSVATGPEVLVTGLYHLESQGLRGAKALDVLRIAAEGAKVGNANLEDVTNALGAAVYAGIKGTGDYTHTMGVLNATVGAGDMHMQDLADAMGTGLPAAAKTYGASITDVGAALAVFGDNNIRGAEAGTRLASALRLMAAPSKVAAKELAGLGLSSTQLADDIRNQGLSFAIQDLKNHMDAMGLDASQQGVVLTRAFGGRQAQGILLLIDEFDRLQQKVSAVGQGGGKFASDWQAYTQQSQYATDHFKASLDVLRIEVGQELLPAFTRATESLSGWLDRMNKSGAATRDTKAAIADVTAVLRTARTVIHDVDDVTGGFNHTLEILLAMKVATTLGAWVPAFGGIATAAGTETTGAAGSVALLSTKLKNLAALGIVTVTVDVLENLIPRNVTSSGQQILNKDGVGGLGKIPLIGPALTAGAYYGQAFSQAVSGPGNPNTNTTGAPSRQYTPAELAAYQAGLAGHSTKGLDVSAPGVMQAYLFGRQSGANPVASGAAATGGGSTAGYKAMAAQAATEYGLPTNLFLAQINQESGFNPNAKSGAGAEGIAQFMPDTAKGYGINPMDPKQALPAAAKMMASLVAKYNGDYGLALAAYNAGSGTVDRFLAGKGSLPLETQNYVKSITGAAVSGYGSQQGSPTQTQLDALGLGAAGGTTKKPKKPPIVSGASEIPHDVTAAIEKYKTAAKNATGSAALVYVQSEKANLEAAQDDLKKIASTQTGKQAAATTREIQTLGKQIDGLTVIRGSQLLPQSLQDAIARFKSDATSSTGAAAAKYLGDEKDALKKALTVLQGEKAGATGAQLAAIKKEADGINQQIATVNKQIAANLKSQAAQIKSTASSTISGDKQAISQAFSQIITDAQTAFANVTSDYITNTLGPKYLQGNDPDSGAPLRTASEALLASMQTADTAQQLQDNLTQARLSGDAAQIAQAQRAIDENNLAIQATQERQQVDADYAKAVKQYQQDRDHSEQEMTNALKALGSGVADGTKSINGPGGLSDVLTQFGVSMDGVSTDDMTALGDATRALAKVMAAEAVALAKVGDSKDAKAAAATAATLLTNLNTPTISNPTPNGAATGNFLPKGSVPMLASGGDIRAAGLAYLHAGERVLPADVVSSPTGGGGGTIVINVNAPNYVGDHRDLAMAIKSPPVQEAVATAVILASRGGHIRQGDIRP